MILGAACNLAIHFVSLQPLFRRSLIKTNIEMASFLATLGAFFVTQTIAIEATGGQALSMNANMVSLGTITILGDPFPLKYLVVGATALLSLGVLSRILYSALGRRLRATAENRLLANVLGIDVQGSQRIAMAIAGAMAGLGGAMIAYLYGQASFGLAESFLVKAIIIGIVAGMGSINGALVVSVGLGIIENATVNLLGSAWRDIASFVVVIAVLAVRPNGLFARQKRLAT
jgi:branched-subunit amino acid ABC-type transport system permease component